MSKRIVIVGGGLAAARTAEQLRRSAFGGSITIVGNEVHLPYDRPPLSKQVLRSELDDVTLKPREFYDDNNITLALGSAVRSLDASAQTVTLDRRLSARIRRGGDRDRPCAAPHSIVSAPGGIHVLRSFDESIALRAEAGSARRAVVVGAGFIGCEVAASLRGLGVDVTMVEPQPEPLASVLGEQIGALVSRLHRAEGVDVRTRCRRRLGDRPGPGGEGGVYRRRRA